MAWVLLSLSAEEVKVEPHVRCLAGVGATTGIVNYKQVCQNADLIQTQGGKHRLNTKVEKISSLASFLKLITQLWNQFVINCAGLHSDRIAEINRSTSSPDRSIREILRTQEETLSRQATDLSCS